jgi:hypothetical protein
MSLGFDRGEKGRLAGGARLGWRIEEGGSMDGRDGRRDRGGGGRPQSRSDPRGRWPSGPRQGAPRASGCVRRLGDGGRGSRAAGQGQGAARLGGGVFWWELGFYLGQFLWAFG